MKELTRHVFRDVYDELGPIWGNLVELRKTMKPGDDRVIGAIENQINRISAICHGEDVRR